MSLMGAAPAYANIIGNTSFEQEIGNGTAGNWDITNGAVRVTPGDGTFPAGFSQPPEGAFALLLATTAQFTFQTSEPVNPRDFVTFSALVESNVANGAGQGAQLRIEFKRVNEASNSDVLISDVVSPFIDSTNAPPGAGFQRFTASGTAPEGTERIVFTLRILGANGNVLFDDVTGDINPAKLVVSASNNAVKPGDAVTIFAQFTNVSDSALPGTQLFADFPVGFDLLPQSVRVNDRRVPFEEGSVFISVGNLGPLETVNTSFQLLVTSAVTTGKLYDILINVLSGSEVSERAKVQLLIRPDPVFEQGTIIGKVFHDANQDGVQNDGEMGVPWVRLFTEEGIAITTDEFGRYFIPAVKVGRHIVKIDGHSLTPGTKFISEESYLVRTTPGIMSKANFAVLLPPSHIPKEFQDDLNVSVTQGIDTSRPALDVTMEPEMLKGGLGVLEKEPIFRFRMNYADFVKTWYLEVRDEVGGEVWTGFGLSAPPAEVTWSGQTEDGFLIKPGIYSYQFKVKDKEGREDWTALKFFRVVSKAEAILPNADIKIPAIGDFNLFQDGKQSIPLVAKPTVRVRGKTLPENSVTINTQHVDVDPSSGLFQIEFYVSPGDKEIVVGATTPDGETTTYRETVTVKDSMFFMVGLGEEELGVNFGGDNIKKAVHDDEFKQGFYEEGRLSYYLKGKLKGKFLIKSRYDSDGASSAFFRNLDPDDYYPVYGDNSERDYEGLGTRQQLFLLIEMDRSYVKWGSFETNFTDTELATYNRTLSGLKAHYETLGSTVYGDPNRAMDLFWNKSSTRGDHNEFAATGGSLYYLRNRSVVEGSEKVRVEIHDKISNISVDSHDLMEGIDYEIDYDEGRIMLSRPLSSVAASDTLVTGDLLDGSPVFLVVDYEFEAGLNVHENHNHGLRGYTHIGDHLKLGGTFVEEKRQNVDYDMRGLDATLKLGRNTKVTAEYAETRLKQVETAVSYNGGLSFAELSPLKGQDEREDAWLIKAESKPIEQLELSGFIQAVNPGFSTDRIRSQEGFKKYGLDARFKVNEKLSVRYRLDKSQLITQLRTPETLGIVAPYKDLRTHTAQIHYRDAKWIAEAEYLRRYTDLPAEEALAPSLLSESPMGNVVAGKLGYQFNERILPYVRFQATLDGKPNHQLGAGVRYEMVNDLYAYLEQMIGNLGDSTYFGFEQIRAEGVRSYANIRMFDRGIGHKSLSTAVGSSFPISKRSRFYSEREHSTYDGVDGYGDIIGLDTKIGDRWNVEWKFERRHLDNSTTRALDAEANAGLTRTNTFNTIAGAVEYADTDKFRARASLEYRRDQDSPRLSQWVIRNRAEYKISDSLSFLANWDYGKSRFLEPDETGAAFTEMNVGLAYRPVDNDKLNLLTKYSYMDNIANDIQFSTGLFTGLPTDERSHILSVDLAYDLHKYVGLVEKLAYKKGIFSSSVTDEIVIDTLLWVNRFNVHVTRKWDIALEYRILMQSEAAGTLKHGTLLEVDREFYDYVRVGLGYNFTDFDDDLSVKTDFDSHGPFVRLTGKF